MYSTWTLKKHYIFAIFDLYCGFFLVLQAGSSFVPPFKTGRCLLIPGSLINHSCFPNANIRIAVPHTELLAVLPIKKGEVVRAINFEFIFSILLDLIIIYVSFINFNLLIYKLYLQICIDYNEEELVKEVRQKNLQFYHDFVCNCVACVNNWPVSSQYPNILVNNIKINIFKKFHLLFVIFVLNWSIFGYRHFLKNICQF